MAQSGNRNRRAVLSLTNWWERYNRERSNASQHHVRAFIRSLAPAPGQHDSRAQVLDQLNSAEQFGHVDSCELSILGEQICRCQSCQTCTEATHLLETAETLAGWEGDGLRSTGFSERTVLSQVTGEEYHVMVPPELSIGVYLDERLVGVFPCLSGGDIFRPSDFARTLLKSDPERPGTTVRKIP